MMKYKISMTIVFVIALMVMFILIDGEQIIIDRSYSKAKPVYEVTVTHVYSGYPAPVEPTNKPAEPTSTSIGYPAPIVSDPPMPTIRPTSTFPPPPPLPEGQVP